MHVVPDIVRLSSGVKVILLFAVTAVVFTVKLTLVTPVGMALDPAAADPHTAGDAPFEHTVAVRYLAAEKLLESVDEHAPSPLRNVVVLQVLVHSPITSEDTAFETAPVVVVFLTIPVPSVAQF